MNLAMVLLTAVLTAATVVLAWATIKYVRALTVPNVSGYFDTDGSWIYLVIQNTGTDAALDTRFTIDLTDGQLAEIFGPNLHGQRYIVYKDLTFLGYVTHLAPGQQIRHQWLFLSFVLRDQKPRPCLLTITYEDRWRKKHQTKVLFDRRQFGTYDQAYAPKPKPHELIADAIKEVEKKLEAIARSLKGGSA
jgi:hypothetical protein